MVQSLNTISDYVTKVIWQRGIPCHDQIMIGDKGSEFYNDKNVLDYTQIPWNEITYVVADAHFKGKYVPRFELRTRNNGNFTFPAKQPIFVLKAIRRYTPADHMRQALSLWQKIKLRSKWRIKNVQLLTQLDTFYALIRLFFSEKFGN